MTIVVGQIEPLKKLKEILNKNGITRFNSIGDINFFIKNYENEKKEIAKTIELSLDEEINHLQSNFLKKQQTYENLKIEIYNELNNNIKKLDDTLKITIDEENKNLFKKVLSYLKVKILSNKKTTLENNLDKIVIRKTRIKKGEVTKAKKTLDDYIKNKIDIISTRCAKYYKDIDYAKEVVDGLYSLIAGAIGENSVVNELRKLSDNCYLINDFSIKFNPPIYNKKENYRIFSIQIDHVLICQSGVFLIETKNWSKNSIDNFDLRSPIEQVLRTSYALFLLLNGNSEFNNISLSQHHWGSKKIPIRNLIAMINNKPKEEFKHVKILSLNELNRYIEYFDPIFSKDEVDNIFNYLNNKKI